jgi:hypothetical protein
VEKLEFHAGTQSKGFHPEAVQKSTPGRHERRAGKGVRVPVIQGLSPRGIVHRIRRLGQHGRISYQDSARRQEGAEYQRDSDEETRGFYRIHFLTGISRMNTPGNVPGYLGNNYIAI